MRPLSFIGLISLIITAIGAINWGLIAFWDYNLVAKIFGTGSGDNTVYIVVGIAAVVSLLSFLGIVDWTSRLGAGGTLLGAVAAIATILAIIGGINWGLVGLFSYNLVTDLLNLSGNARDTIYAIIGIAGLVALVLVPFTAAAGESRRRGVLDEEVTSRRAA